MPRTTTAHIHLDDRGRAWIDDTNTKVIEVVLDQMAYGWSPEEIHFQHAHLSMAQIHAALSYYYDHQAEFNAEIERQLKEYDTRRATVEDGCHGCASCGSYTSSDMSYIVIDSDHASPWDDQPQHC